VIVYEQCQPYRDKSCGDMFLPRAVDTLRRMGLNDAKLRAAGGREFRSIDVIGTRGRLWQLRYPESPIWVIPRRSVDQALRDCLAPDVRVQYGTSITEVVPGCHQVVILACGAASTLAAAWDIDGHPLRVGAISAYEQGSELAEPAFEFSARELSGYRWVFPMSQPGQVNAGVFSLGRASGAALKRMGSKMVAANSSPDWRGGVGTLWSGRGERWFDPRGVFSCGDAGGLIDPLTGEGLSAALASGEAAGICAAKFLAGARNPKYLENYSRWIKSYFTQAYARTPLRTVWRHLSGCADVNP
jgi:flavin-dependent dehydrogenase